MSSKCNQNGRAGAGQRIFAELSLVQPFDACVREVVAVVGDNLAALKVDIGDRIDQLNLPTTASMIRVLWPFVRRAL